MPACKQLFLGLVSFGWKLENGKKDTYFGAFAKVTGLNHT